MSQKLPLHALTANSHSHSQFGYQWVLSLFKNELGQIFSPLAKISSSVFFIWMITMLYPIALEPDINTLVTMAPGVMLVSILLLVLLQVQNWVQEGYESGAMEAWLCSGAPMALWVICQCICMSIRLWIAIMVVLPFWIVAYGLASLSSGTAQSLDVLLLANFSGVLFLLTPTLVMVSYFAKALTLGLKQENVLLGLLIMPLLVPMVIFGGAALKACILGESLAFYLYLLAAAILISISVFSFLTASVLRLNHG